MKKKVFAACFCLIIAFGVILTVKGIERNKTKPEDRNVGETQSGSEEQTTFVDIAEDSSEDNIVTSDINEENNVSASDNTENADEDINIEYTVVIGQLKYHFLSYEIMEDTEVEACGKYNAEYFYSGDFPDTEYKENIVDYNAIAAESPEMYEYYFGDTGYSDEDQEIYERNIDIINKYTTYEHPETKYLFVKCEITNLSEDPLSERVSIYTANAAADGSNWAFHDNTRYFDKSVNLQGEDRTHDFFLYNFKAGETLECTLGFECRVEFGEDEIYYLGDLPAGVDVLDPKSDEHFTRIDTLPKTDE